MRLLVRTGLLVGILAMGSFLQSCQSGTMVKHWKVNKFETDQDFSESEEHQKIFKQFVEKATMHFEEDGTYSFDFVSVKQKGTWEYNKMKKTLTTTAEDGTVTVAKILELSENQLVVEQENNGFVSTMTLNPIEN